MSLWSLGKITAPIFILFLKYTSHPDLELDVSVLPSKIDVKQFSETVVAYTTKY